MNIWLPSLLAFAGGLIGASIPALVTLRGQRQAARVEWRHRLDRAVDLIAEGRQPQRDIGKELLADLITSDLGPVSDQDLAYRVSRLAIPDLGAPMQNGGKEDA